MSVEISVIDRGKREEWGRFIQRNEKAIAWQSYEWSDVLARHYDCKFFPIAAFDAGEIVGVLPLYLVKTPSGSRSLISVPHAVAGGIVADDPRTEERLLGKAVELSREHDSCRIVLKQYKHRVGGDLLTDDNYYNRELSLSKNIGEVWDKLSVKNRDVVRSMEDSPASLIYPSSDLSLFHGLLLRHLHSRGIPCVGKRWIEDLIGFRMYSMALLMVDGDPVAGTLVKEFKKTVSFPFTCLSRKRGKENIGFAFRLYWELIKEYSSKGFEIFHSGRIPNNDDTDEYRLGWGGEKYGYYYQYFPNTPGKTEYGSKRGRKRAIMENIWKALPVRVAGAAGPYVIRRFP